DWPFHGAGLRIHRKGGDRTDATDFFGHTWQAALFPSGRGFEVNRRAPAADGTPKFSEVWVVDDGQQMPAEIVETSWMPDMQPSREDVSFDIRTARGPIHVEAETVMSTFTHERPIREGVTFPALQQGIARYRWDGEEAYGMIERSIPRTI